MKVVYAKVDWNIMGNQVDCFSYWELLYADDTMLIGNRARGLNIIIAEIEDFLARTSRTTPITAVGRFAYTTPRR